MSDDSPSLNFEQRLRAAHAHFILGVKQHDVAAILSVNAGRVAEACKAVELALQDPKGTSELLKELYGNE